MAGAFTAGEHPARGIPAQGPLLHSLTVARIPRVPHQNSRCERPLAERRNGGTVTPNRVRPALRSVPGRDEVAADTGEGCRRLSSVPALQALHPHRMLVDVVSPALQTWVSEPTRRVRLIRDVHDQPRSQPLNPGEGFRGR